MEEIIVLLKGCVDFRKFKFSLSSTFLLQTKLLFSLTAVLFSLNLAWMKSILQVHYLYITFTIGERKVWVIFDRHILRCVSNVFNQPITSSLDRLSGYQAWIFQVFYGFFPIENIFYKTSFAILDFVPVLAQCFSLSLFWDLLNQLRSTVSHVLSRNWIVHITGWAD